MKLKRLFFFLIILFITFSAFAQNARTEGSHVIDNAGLLSPEQKSHLEGRIVSIAAMYNFDLVIVTERDIGGSDPGQYADRFFDNNGYGWGPNRDGSIFLQVTASRDYSFSPSGRGRAILNNAAYSKLESDTVKYLKDDKPFEAYQAFIGNWEEFLQLDYAGRNYNFFHRYNVALVIAAWVLAYIIASLITAAWKSKMNTALAGTQADAYTVPGSLSYNVKTDRFLYSNVTKTRKQQQSSSGGSSTGGSRGRSGKY